MSDHNAILWANVLSAIPPLLVAIAAYLHARAASLKAGRIEKTLNGGDPHRWECQAYRTPPRPDPPTRPPGDSA